MRGLLYADGYFPAACGLYQYDPELYNEFSGLTRPGYRHPSGYSTDHIYSSFLDNLTVEQAAKIYWRGRVIAAASTPHSAPTYSSSHYGAPPLHLLPTSRTRWGSHDPAMRVCGDWGNQPIDMTIYADPEIPAGRMGPPNSSNHYATPFAAQNMGVTCNVGVFCYFDNNRIKYGVVFEGYISVQGVFWHWDWEEEFWQPWWLDYSNLSAAFGPRGDEGGVYVGERMIQTPWGNFMTLVSNDSLDNNIYYNITIETDETLQ